MIDTKLGTKILTDVRNTLKFLELKYFLIDGTLLGLVREGGFIKHDTDLDIGVFAEEFTEQKLEELTYALQGVGFSVVHKIGELDKYLELSFRRDGLKIDLFFYHLKGDKRVFHAFRNGGRNLPDDVITYEYPAIYFEKLIEAELNGEKFMIPDKPIRVLLAKYGNDWRTPNTKWNWADDPKNKIHG